MAIVLTIACLIALPVSLASTNNVFKHHYIATLERVEVDNVNSSCCNVSVRMRFFNRTTKALCGTFGLYVDLPDDSYVVINEHRFLSNQYKLTAIQMKMKLRQALQVDWLGLQSFYRQANPPIVWPLKKGTYTIDNWIHDDKKIPFPYAPVGYWRMTVSLYISKETKMFDLMFYDHVTDVVDL